MLEICTKNAVFHTQEEKITYSLLRKEKHFKSFFLNRNYRFILMQNFSTTSHFKQGYPIHRSHVCICTYTHAHTPQSLSCSWYAPVQSFLDSMWFETICFVYNLFISQLITGFPSGSVVKNSPAVEEIPRGMPGNPLQYSCLENPMDRGAWCVQCVESQRVRRD